MVVHSMAEQKELGTIEALFNGSWVVAAHGHKIICQIGY